jgi:hypothetical protein
VDFELSAEERAFEVEVEAFLREHASPDVMDACPEQLSQTVDTPPKRAFMRKLAERGWLGMSWPKEYGGQERPGIYDYVLTEALSRHGAPQPGKGVGIVGKTIIRHGSERMKREFLPRIMRGEIEFAIGYSEPGAGSDAANMQLRATKVDGGWRLDGQKTWTTRGAFCTHLFGLFRTDPESERHRGLSYLLVPLDTPGVTVRGFGRLDGDEGFAEVFFDDAFLADDAVPGGVLLGDEGAGWKVAMATTGSERGLTLRSPGRFLATAARLIDLYREDPQPRLRERLTQAWMRAEAYRLFTLDTVTRLAGGAVMGADSSINKVWWSELDVELHEIALELLGPEAEAEGPWSKGWQFSLSGPIYAGTNEIQRNIAAERMLGLPRK